MSAIRQVAFRGGAALAALALIAPGAASAAKLFVNHAPPAATQKNSSIGTFTPAAADARRAASFGRVGFGGTGFRFTPSGTLGSSRAVTVAMRARSTAQRMTPDRTAPANSTPSLAPIASNLGVSLGWKRFAISGDVAKYDGGLLPNDRESADVGLSYSGRNWSTRLLLGADRATGDSTRLIGGTDDSYSVDLAGAYALTHSVEVTGGVRYKLQHDRLDQSSDVRRDSQAVYVGTSFKF